MFDEITCLYPLPGTPPDFLGDEPLFQTKSLECEMEHYVIAKNGTIPDAKEFSGDIRMYAGNVRGLCGRVLYTENGEDAERVEYIATVESGTVVRVVEVEVSKEPAFPMSQFNDYHVHEEEFDIEANVGDSLYVAYGGRPATEGYFVTVEVARVNDVCVDHDGKLEILGRWQFGSTVFADKESAITRESKHADAWKQREAAYDRFVASRKDSS